MLPTGYWLLLLVTWRSWWLLLITPHYCLFPLLVSTKKGSKLECANYRPISLLSNLDKSLIENIEKAKDNEVFVRGVFVDLQKAFDIVEHNILLHELSLFGI